MKVIRRLIYDFNYVFLNHLVNYIPVWTIRASVYRVYGMRIGKGARIGIGTKVIMPGNITLANRAIVNENCYLDGRGGLEIGEDSSISHGTTIITASHDMNNNFQFYASGVKIGSHVWVGTKAMILDGSVLEDGCVIGAGSVIKTHTKKKGVYVGNPAHCIKQRKDELEYKIVFSPFFR